MCKVNYINPFIHTVYYFRDMYNPSDDKIDLLKAIFSQAQGIKNEECVDFAFNENVNCSTAANGVFMRLNACSLLKLRYYCLYPTESRCKKVVQYLATLFLSPLAALIDLIVNVSLLILKILAWPILRVCSDAESKEYLSQHLGWQLRAVGESLDGIVWALIGSLTLGSSCITNRSTPLWGYRVLEYKGTQIPHKELTSFCQPSLSASDALFDYYETWFKEGKPMVLLDPQRVRYLREECGWKLSDEQFKEIGLDFPAGGDFEIVFRPDLKKQELFVVVKGRHYSTRGGGIVTENILHKTLQWLSIAIPEPQKSS